jgi:integrase/recombinase XerC/integrase/recombinase XerD
MRNSTVPAVTVRTAPATGTAGETKATSLLPSSKAERKRVVDAFLAAQDVKDSSLRTYRDALNQYFIWLDTSGRTLMDLTAADIVEYKKELLREGHTSLTVRSYLTAVKRFYKWAEGMRFYPDIAADVKAPRVSSGGAGEHFIKMHLTEEQATELLSHLSESPRNYAMVNLMLRTGIRTIEVSRARVEDVKWRSGRRILQVWGKGMDAPDPSVFVVLTDTTWGPIRDYLATRDEPSGDEFLFATEGHGSHTRQLPDGRSEVRPHGGGQMSTRLIQMIIKDALRAIGLDSHAYSAHSLRHTTATQIIKNGGTILDVKRALRHSSVNTSMIYTASIEEEERMLHAPEDLLDRSFKTERK